MSGVPCRRLTTCLVVLGFMTGLAGCGSLQKSTPANIETEAAAPASPQPPVASPPQPATVSTESTSLSAVTPVIPQPAQTMPLDLPEALGLAGAENPTIAIAR